YHPKRKCVPEFHISSENASQGGEGSALQEVGQEMDERMESDDVSEVCSEPAGEVLESGALRKRKAQASLSPPEGGADYEFNFTLATTSGVCEP
ncbi:MAG: hypothetical protein SGPRY_009271, partial [Prymnesium sp.]